MRDFENAIFLAIFLAACAFTAIMVDGVLAKLWFTGWAGCILAGAAWFYKEEKKVEDVKKSE